MRARHFFLSAALGIATGLSIAASASAAEPGTYRPGNPYYSSQAGSASVCENQCAGDAQCKGWNFVKINPQAASGVCEFNSQAVSAVPSPISTSGENGVAIPPKRLSVGGTNTVRVGTPTTQKPVTPARTPRIVKSQATQHISPDSVRPGARAIRPGQSAPQRRIVREPVPTTMRPDTTVNKSRVQPAQPPRYMPSQAAPRPRFQHNLDAGHPSPRMNAPRPPRPQMMPPETAQPPAMNGGDPRLQRMVRDRAMPTRPAAQPLRAAPTSTAVQPPQAPVQPQRPMTAAQAEQSLFGSLHDDVKAPKPVTPQEASNPDAPISTVQAMPTVKVTTENLLGLAGAPKR